MAVTIKGFASDWSIPAGAKPKLDEHNAALLQNPATATGTALGATYATKSSVAPTARDVVPASWFSALRQTKKTKVITWGSSTLEGLATALSAKVAEQGATFTNGAKGGERSEHILARMGARPALLVFPNNTIPASGSVTVTATNLTPSVNMMAYTGTVNGVAGTLSGTDTALTFTRTTAGTAVPAGYGAPFISDLGVTHRDSFAIINVTKNDLTGDHSQTPTLVDRTRMAMMHLHKQGIPYIVVGHYANTGVGGDGLRQVLELNQWMKIDADPVYFDLQGYVTGSQIWADTGITPTQADLDQQAAGQKPSSLSSDSAHLNEAASAAVASKIQAFLTANAAFPVPAAATSGFVDTFSRADAITDIGITETGNKPWRIVGNNADGTNGHLLIENGRVGIGGLATNRVVGYVNAGIADGVFKFDLPMAVPAGSPWTVLRMTDINNLLYLSNVSGSDHRWALWRRQGAASTAAIIGTGTAPMASGDHVEVTLEGSSITVTVNGAQQFTVTETAQATATQFGVCVWGTSAGQQNTRWDNMQMLAA